MTLAPLPVAVEDEIDRTIGFNVQSILFRRDTAHKALASALDVTPSVLSKKLRGRSAWSARQVAITAKFLDVPPGRLYEEVTVASLRRNFHALPGGRSSRAPFTQPGLTTSVHSVHTGHARHIPN